MTMVESSCMKKVDAIISDSAPLNTPLSRSFVVKAIKNRVCRVKLSCRVGIFV